MTGMGSQAGGIVLSDAQHRLICPPTLKNARLCEGVPQRPTLQDREPVESLHLLCSTVGKDRLSKKGSSHSSHGSYYPQFWLFAYNIEGSLSFFPSFYKPCT